MYNYRMMTCVALFICLVHTVMSFNKFPMFLRRGRISRLMLTTVDELNKLSKEELALRLIGNEMRDELRSEVAILGAIKDVNTKISELNLKIDNKTSEMNVKIDNLTAKILPLQFVYGGGLVVLGVVVNRFVDLSKILIKQ